MIALYTIESKRSRVARLAVIMLDREAAERHADALAAEFGYVNVETVSVGSAAPAPLTLSAVDGSIPARERVRVGAQT